jgi:zinc/manganese transport system substrate-binding protein
MRSRVPIPLLAISLLGATVARAAPLHVVCTLPVLATLTDAVGGDLVETTTLAKGDQDPHFVSPTPLLMKKTREADAFVELGLSLELWADQVVNGAGNAKLYHGLPGRIVASAGVPLLEVPTVLSREFGDVHPEGNPHVWLDPLRAKMLAETIAKGLSKLRPESAERFDQNLKAFAARIDERLFGKELVDLAGGAKLSRLALDGTLDSYLDSTKNADKPLRQSLGGWLAKAAPLRGVKVVEYHKSWVYFASRFGFEIVGDVEERPGIPPGPQHQQETIALVRRDKVPILLTDNFYDPKLPDYVAGETGAKDVIVPSQVHGDSGIDDYPELVDAILDRMLKALPK